MTNLIRPLLKALSLLAGSLLLLGILPLRVPAAPSVTRIEARSPGGLQGVLEFAAAPLVTMHPTPFRLALKGVDGTPFPPSTLTCDLVMPAMPMPENRPRLVSDGEDFRGEAIFTMAGAWQARVTVHPVAGAEETLVFPIERVLLK